MAAEVSRQGYVSAEVWQMVIDEEKTQASEILAAQEQSYAAIPRTYYSSKEGLIDRHGQSLNKVFDDGIAYSQGEREQGVPGADWELQRRYAERSNLKKITDMPEGTICIEVSAPPSDKPDHEVVAQHYNGLTMIRASIKAHGDGGKVRQFNYALPLDSPDFLLAVQAKLGVAGEQRTINSQQLLENPVMKRSGDSAEAVAREIDGLIGAALLESAVGHSAVRMLTRTINNRREAWQFINSAEHQDLDAEIFASMHQAAKLKSGARAEIIKAIRSGYWKELKDRFRGRRSAGVRSVEAGSVLAAAAERAVADGDVFIACGNTVKATSFNQAERADIIKLLRREVKGSGKCQGCGARGALYGCGLCSRCNKKWCDEYENSGKQTDIRDLAYRAQARGEANGILESALTELGRGWQKIKTSQLARAA